MSNYEINKTIYIAVCVVLIDYGCVTKINLVVAPCSLYFGSKFECANVKFLYLTFYDNPAPSAHA